MFYILIFVFYIQKVFSLNAYSNFTNLFCNKQYLCCFNPEEKFCIKNDCNSFFKIGLGPHFSETSISLDLAGVLNNNSDVKYYSICFENSLNEFSSCVDLFYCNDFKNKFYIETSLYSTKNKLSKVDLSRNFNVIDGVEIYISENYFQIFWLRKKVLNHSGIFFNLINNTHGLIFMYGQASYYKNENKVLKNNPVIQKCCNSVLKISKYSNIAFSKTFLLRTQIIFILVCKLFYNQILKL